MNTFDANGDIVSTGYVAVEIDGLLWAAETHPHPVEHLKAQQLVAQMTLLGRTWRLPTEQELRDLPANLAVFGDIEGREWTWSATPGLYCGLGKADRPFYSTSDIALVRAVSG